MGECAATLDRRSKDLYAIRFKGTIKAGRVAAMIVCNYKHETRRSGDGSQEKWAWDALVEKYCFESAEIIRDMMD